MAEAATHGSSHMKCLALANPGSISRGCRRGEQPLAVGTPVGGNGFLTVDNVDTVTQSHRFAKVFFTAREPRLRVNAHTCLHIFLFIFTLLMFRDSPLLAWDLRIVWVCWPVSSRDPLAQSVPSTLLAFSCEFCGSKLRLPYCCGKLLHLSCA